MRGIFELYEPKGERLDLAIDRLTSALQPFTFAGVLFRRGEQGEVVCEAVTQWGDIATQESAAQEDLARAQASCERLCAASPAFAGLVRDASVRYAVIEDMETSTFEVCREEKGMVVWARLGKLNGRGHR